MLYFSQIPFRAQDLFKVTILSIILHVIKHTAIHKEQLSVAVSVSDCL